MSNLKPKFGPKVCLAHHAKPSTLHWGKTLVLLPSLQPYIVGQNACFVLPHVKLETQILAKGLPSQALTLSKTLVLRSRMSNVKPKFWPKVWLAPPCQAFNLIHWGKTLVLRSRMSNLKSKFGPKVCLAPPCQAFNITLGQNACFTLPHVKLETHIRAKGLSSPTMPSLQPYIGAKRLFCAPACQT